MYSRTAKLALQVLCMSHWCRSGAVFFLEAFYSKTFSSRLLLMKSPVSSSKTCQSSSEQQSVDEHMYTKTRECSCDLRQQRYTYIYSSSLHFRDGGDE